MVVTAAIVGAFMVGVLESTTMAQSGSSVGPTTTATTSTATTMPPPTTAPAIDPAMTNWLREHAIPVRTVAAESGLDDLQAVGSMVGDSRIVALGEATHGSREFFQMKHRMIEYLVKEKGFHVFAIEAGWASANELNAYVQSKPGAANQPANARQLLRKYAYLMWPWRTEEVLELIEWMRDYNNRPTTKVKVQFTGFDMQEPVPAVDLLTDYLDGIDPKLAKDISSLLSCIRFSLSNVTRIASYAAGGEAGANRCGASLRTAETMLQKQQAKLEKASSKAAYSTAAQYMRVLQQTKDYYFLRFAQDPSLGFSTNSRNNLRDAVAERDVYMAENVAWLLKHHGPQSKVIVWAHNGHVSFNPKISLGFKPMGAHLRERFGKDYFVMGFSFFEGRFNAQRINFADPARTFLAASLGLGALPSPATVPLPVANSYERIFDSLGEERFILDVRPAFTDPAAKWLLGPRPLFLVPQNLPPFDAKPDPAWYSYNAQLPKDFDAVIYIRNTTPTKLIPM
jgi:erythromycin esterase